MSVHILVDPDYGRGVAVLMCSTTDVAFGPVIFTGPFDNGSFFDALRVAQAFLRWLPKDARTYADCELASKWSDFIAVGIKSCDYGCDNATAKTQPFCSFKCEREFEREKEEALEEARGGEK